jgi:hypothetical protein
VVGWWEKASRAVRGCGVASGGVGWVWRAIDFGHWMETECTLDLQAGPCFIADCVIGCICDGKLRGYFCDCYCVWL